MYETILVPLDGSKRAESIISHVAELARKFNSKLILLSAVETRLSQGDEEMASASMGSFSTVEEEIKQAETYLSHLQKELTQKGIQTETKVITGLPVQVIKEAVEQEKADLIAIASHGRGGLARVFFGSVANEILRQVDRPLLLVRSQSIKEQ